jgi:hypothetical protein
MRYGIRKKTAACRQKASKIVKLLCCWRCQIDIPMLEEHEAAHVLEDGSDQERIRRRYFAVTGIEETNANAIWHHVVSLYGAPCSSCGRPLRTAGANVRNVWGQGGALKLPHITARAAHEIHR